MVKVLYFAELKLITQKEKEDFKLKEEKTVKELINKLIEIYPKLKKILISNDGEQLKNTISISVNHSVVKQDDPFSLQLDEDDVIAFLLPVSGG